MSTHLDPIFPGMDPFIEGDNWVAFHNSMIHVLIRTLVLLLAPRYRVTSEEFVDIHLRPDVTLRRPPGDAEPLRAWTVQPNLASHVITATLTEVGEQQRHIEIRDEKGMLVTIVELLSPTNKRWHRPVYLLKRDAVLQSEVNLVEIDLLRGGRRMEDGLPAEGYVTLVCRAQEESCHRCEVFLTSLRERLPNLPIPLLAEDGDVGVSLQDAFNEVYRDLGFRLYIDYSPPLDPPVLNPDDATWLADRLREAGVLP